uniref:Uncharacterized protein n=1 Tax=Anguilla anguilla TaxID=7936 RepID=A0A0E9RB51_ANGAN
MKKRSARLQKHKTIRFIKYPQNVTFLIIN